MKYCFINLRTLNSFKEAGDPIFRGESFTCAISGESRVISFNPNPSANLVSVEREVDNINRPVYNETPELWIPSIAFFDPFLLIVH